MDIRKRDQVEKEIQEEARIAAIQIKNLKENPLTIFPPGWVILENNEYRYPKHKESYHASALIAIDALQKSYMSPQMAMQYIEDEFASDDDLEDLNIEETIHALQYYSIFTKSTLRWLWWAIFEQDYSIVDDESKEQ